MNQEQNIKQTKTEILKPSQTQSN